MSEILFQYYKIHPTTWVYVSSLLIIAVYFKFNRFWSVRNLDLVMLILLAPGMLMVNLTLPWREPAAKATDATAASPATPPAVSTSLATADAGSDIAEPAAPAPAAVPPSPSPETANYVAYIGYLWLFAISACWLIRLLLDPTMVRRPLLEPNLSNGGLVFLGCALFIFLMANVITSDLTPDDLRGAEGAHALIQGRDTTGQADAPEDYRQHGPGNPLLHLLPSIPSTTFVADAAQPRAYMLVAKTMAILGHLAVVSALIVIGYWHFENIKMGIGAAALYLMLPYTAQMTGHVDHVLPAALLLWAIVFYRRPALAGIFLGLAAGVNYYPLFLLPLWISFYWQRGFARFLLGTLGAIAVIVLSLVFVSRDLHSFWLKFQPMFALWIPKTSGLEGIWGGGWDPWYRLPVIAGCVALAAGLAIWPTHKNLGTLLSCSAAMMVAVQFWHGYGDGGGMYMAWYLPLLLMTVFRPNLEDRVALTVLGEGWFLRRRARLAQLGKAA